MDPVFSTMPGMQQQSGQMGGLSGGDQLDALYALAQANPNNASINNMYLDAYIQSMTPRQPSMLEQLLTMQQMPQQPMMPSMNTMSASNPYAMQTDGGAEVNDTEYQQYLADSQQPAPENNGAPGGIWDALGFLPVSALAGSAVGLGQGLGTLMTGGDLLTSGLAAQQGFANTFKPAGMALDAGQAAGRAVGLPSYDWRDNPYNQAEQYGNVVNSVRDRFSSLM